MSHPESQAHDTVARKLTTIAQYVLVVVFGLLPIFFVPLAAAPFNYSKVTFVIVGTLVALVLYGFATLRGGSIRLALAPVPAMLWIVAFAGFVAALLSGDFRDAVVGETFGVHTVLFIGLLALVATAWTILGENKQAIMRLFMLFALSTLALSVFHILRLVLGSDALTLGFFGGDATLSPFGGWNDLAIFFGLTIILAIVALEQLPLTRTGQVLFALVVASALAMLAVVNFFAVWVVLAIISLAVLIYALTKGRGESKPVFGKQFSAVSGTSLGISCAVLIISVLFILGGGMLGNTIAGWTGISYIEVRPSIGATVEIAKDTYAEQALFGVGPNRFADAWRTFKDPAINESLFWNTDFAAGFGYLPTFFVTTGVVGGIAWVLFLIAFLVTGLRMLLRPVATDRTWYFIGTVAFVGGLYIWGMSVLYVPGPVLLLIAALCAGLVGAAHAALMRTAGKEVRAVDNRRMSFVFVVVFIVTLIGSVGGLYYVGRHYAAVYVFNTGFVRIAEGATIDEVEQRTVRAFELSPDDAYARRLAEYQLARIQSLLAVSEPTEVQQQEFTNALNTGINAAQIAVAADSSDPRNWNTLGNMYAALVPAEVEGAYERSLEAFVEARRYDPQNPLHLLVMSQLAAVAGKEAEARGYLTEAIALKQNYTDAIFFLAQLDIAAGNTEAALQATRAVVTLEPQNPVRFFQLGVLQYSDGQVAEAAASLERAVLLNPEYANARYYLALVYDALDRQDDARTQLARILRSNPDNPLVMDLLSRLERGESLAERAPAQVDEPAGVSQGADGVTTETPPDTALVTPVNTPGEGAVE